MSVIELSEDDFEQIVTENDFVIIDYWSPVCGPCRSFAPVFEKVADEYPEILFAKVNTEEQQKIAMGLSIRTVPTVMILRDQIVVFNKPGALIESAFREIICKAIELDMSEVQKQIKSRNNI